MGQMTWASKYTLQLTKSLATKTSGMLPLCCLSTYVFVYTEIIKLEFNVVDLMIFISCAGIVLYHLFTKVSM